MSSLWDSAKGNIKSSLTGDLTPFLGDGGAGAAAAGLEAAAMAQASEREKLEYLKERERLPRQFQEAGLTNLAGIYGLPGGTGSQQELIDRAMESPLYQQLMGGRELGEEAILRNQSMTGGLRSGNTQHNLYDYNTQLQNQALTQSYGDQLSGIQGMAGLANNTNTIANAIAAPGITGAQGITAAAQALQSGQQAQSNALLGLGGAALAAFSDIRLKDNIKHVGEKNGHQLFTWDWKDNDLGLSGEGAGVMAHLVYETNPEAVSVIDGNLIVDYATLGVL